MNAFEPERAILTSLLERYSGPGRVIQAGSKPLRDLVLAELDMTFMPRMLQLGNDKGKTISLDVANRKVIRIVGGNIADLPSITDVVGAPMSRDHPDSIVGLNAALDALLEDAETVSIETSEISQPQKMGYAVAELYALPDAAVKADDIEAKGVLAFARDVEAHCKAWLVTENEALAHEHGPDADVAALKQYAATYLPDLLLQHRRNYPDQADRGFAVRSEESSGQSFVCGWSKETAIVAITATSSISDVLTSWRSMI